MGIVGLAVAHLAMNIAILAASFAAFGEPPELGGLVLDTHGFPLCPALRLHLGT